MCKCKVIGSVTIVVLTENESGASWYELDSKFGQVKHAFYGRFVIEYFMPLASILTIQWISACIDNPKTSGCRSACVLVQLKHFQILIGNLVLGKTTPAFLNVNIIPIQSCFPAPLKNAMELSPRERWYWISNVKRWLKALALCKSYINFLMMKYFPQQIIMPYVGVQYRMLTRTYNLLIYLIYLLSLQIVHQSYSCALDRCFLLHGRMYISQWHLCFHSNVFSKQLNVSKYSENGSWNLM